MLKQEDYKFVEMIYNNITKSYRTTGPLTSGSINRDRIKYQSSLLLLSTMSDLLNCKIRNFSVVDAENLNIITEIVKDFPCGLILVVYGYAYICPPSGSKDKQRSWLGRLQLRLTNKNIKFSSILLREES